ncbi:MAG: PKD domain-containing protein [Planctomycetota bacterium]|jgi:hypothetical protein
MRSFRLVLWVVWIGALPFFGSCGKQIGGTKTPEKGTIEGVVEDAKTGDPIEGAVVKAGKEIELTSPDGKYKIELVPGGYRISVSKEGFAKYLSPAEVKVEAAGSAMHDVRLDVPKVEPPKAVFEKVPPPLTNERDATFTWKHGSGGTEGGKIVFATLLEGLDGAYSPLGPETKRTFRDLGDGKYVFKVKARDTKTGTEGEPAEHEFEVDGTPPLDPSITLAEESKFVGTRAVDVIISAEGAAEVAVWEGRQPTMLSWAPFRDRKQVLMGKGDGEKIIFARFKDKAGNVTDNVSCSVILDRNAPTRPGNLRAQVKENNDVRLSWNPAKDEGSGIEEYTLRRDGVEIGRTRETTFVDRKAELGSEYDYTVSATDKMGQESDSTSPVRVDIKGRPPETPVAPNPPDGAESQATGFTMTWRGGDPDRGDTVTYDLYLGTNPTPPMRAGPLTSPSFVVTDLKPSTKYLWRVEAKDAQGLVAKGPLWTFTTAEKANSLPIANVSVAPAQGGTSTKFRFSAAASKDAEDPPSALEVRWDVDGDGEPDTDWTTEKTLTKTFDDVGSHTVQVEVRDTQEGVATASATVEVSNSPPVLEGDPIPANASTGEPIEVKLSWTYKDPDPDDKLTYDVYLGKADEQLRAVARGIEESAYKPPEPFARGTVYYWRVDARDSKGEVTRGPLWSFATAKKAVRLPFHAEVAVKPKKGRTTTPFHFDASSSSDPDEPSEALKVRWDFDGDEEFDTDWTSEKTAVNTFTKMGVLKVVVEVKNSKGEVVSGFMEIEVENTPPTFVGKPTPENGAAGLDGDVTLKWKATDPDPEDQSFFRIHFASATAGALLPVAEEVSESNYRPAPWLKPGTYNWKVEAEDSHGAKTESPIWTFTVKARDNNPPLKPEALEGPLSVRFGQQVVFKAKARDKDGDAVRVRFDWGDGSVSPWEPAGEGGFHTAKHHYAQIGEYKIRAQTIDDKQASSAWSETHPLKVLRPLKRGEEEEDVWHWDPKILEPMPDLLTFKLRYWFANLGGSGEWKGVGNPQADLAFGSDLGITERKGAPWLHAEIGYYITGGMEYFVLEYSGSTTFTSDADFSGATFPAGTDVDASCQVRFGHFFATFNPYLGHYFGGGFKLGMGYFWNRTTVAEVATGARRIETIEFPIPVIGIRLSGIVTKFFRVTGEFSYITGALQEFDLRSGSLIDVSGDVTFTPVHWIGISLGYRYTGINVRVRETDTAPDTELDMRLDGFVFSVIAHF